MASTNPFRRNKQAQILGIDHPTVINTADDVSVRSMKFFGRPRRDAPAADAGAAHAGHDCDAHSLSKRSAHSGDDGSSFGTSIYNAHSPADEEEDPFTEEVDDDLLDDYPPPSPLARRRTMPDKAARLIGMDDPDRRWRAPAKLGTHPSLRGRHGPPDSPDSHEIPLKAQKMLGITARGHMKGEGDFKADRALSPQAEHVAPKAQKMLGIAANPFQKVAPGDETRRFYGDELDQHGMLGPTSTTAPSRRQMDVDDFKRMLLSGERDSLRSSQDDTLVETPRSSHEAVPRHRHGYDHPSLAPPATTSSAAAAAAAAADNYPPPSPGSFDDTSPSSLNKPLPPAPPQMTEHTFELAGSFPTSDAVSSSAASASAAPPTTFPAPPASYNPAVPNPSKRRLLQQTRHAAARAMQQRATPEPRVVPTPAMEPPTAPVELPAEPVQSPTEGPGSQFDPIELPAREATPIDSPPRNTFRSTSSQYTRDSTMSIDSQMSLLTKQLPPAVPPPRRGGSHRSTIMMPQGIAELAEKSPEPHGAADGARAVNTRNSFASDQMIEAARAMASGRPQPPPSRTLSAQRIDRFSNAARASGGGGGTSSSNSGADDGLPGSPPKTPNGRLPPVAGTPPPQAPHAYPPPSGPPPTGKLPPTPPPHRRQLSGDAAASPTTPRVRTELPRLHTQMSNEISFTDQLVSALSPQSSAMPPPSQGRADSAQSESTSLVSALSDKKPSLGSIAMAVATNPNRYVSPDRRPSKQDMAALEAVVHDDRRSASEKIDVLADLGILQQEVDALRRQFAAGDYRSAESSPGMPPAAAPPRTPAKSQQAAPPAADTAPPEPKHVVGSTAASRDRSDAALDDLAPHPGVAWDPARAAGASEPSTGEP